MLHPSRDRISVDLQGLKAALFGRAQAAGVSPSDLVRQAVAQALAVTGTPHFEPQQQDQQVGSAARVRLTLRMTCSQAQACTQAARRAGMHPGDFVAGLVAGVPVLTATYSRPELIATLVACTAEMSTLSRNINHLTALLRQGAFRAAQEYRPMLETLGADVRAHLVLMSGALSELQPKAARANAAKQPTNR